MNEYYRKMAPKGKENQHSNSNVLLELEKDHRNLVKHCLTMEEEIKYVISNSETTPNKWGNSMK